MLFNYFIIERAATLFAGMTLIGNPGLTDGVVKNASGQDERVLVHRVFVDKQYFIIPQEGDYYSIATFHQDEMKREHVKKCFEDYYVYNVTYTIKYGDDEKEHIIHWRIKEKDLWSQSIMR